MAFPGPPGFEGRATPVSPVFAGWAGLGSEPQAQRKIIGTTAIIHNVNLVFFIMAFVSFFMYSYESLLRHGGLSGIQG
jgi:hypothetical protein